MTAVVLETIKQVWCDRRNDSASLLEKRVYLGDTIMNAGAGEYRVIGRYCAHDIECNVAGYPCKWSYLNSENDPYKESVPHND